MDTNRVNSDETPRINSDALNGLRGLASLHILVFHGLLYSTWEANIIGSMEMPLFFLISGYSLALSYGRTEYHGYTKCCCKSIAEDGVREPLLFKTFNFYRNRFARIMPMYYFSNFVLGLTAYLFAFETTPYSDMHTAMAFGAAVFDSLIPIGMILPGSLWPIVGATWTISTLWFFYLLFPVLLPRLQKYSNEKCSKWIVLLYWIQLVVGIVFGITFSFVNQWPWLQGYWISTGWGVSRLPVFLMGVLAGLQRLRLHNNSVMLQRNQITNFINACVPFRIKSNDAVESSSQRWACLINVINVMHILIIFASVLLGSLVSDEIPGAINWGIQLTGVYSLLTVVDGVTRDDSHSVISKICNTRMMQQLGRASMTLYLIHEPLMKWLGFGIKKWREEPIPERYMKTIQFTIIIPVWGSVIIVLICPFFAWMLTKWVEEPLRSSLRAPVDVAYTSE